MKAKRFILTAMAYLVLTFSFAVFWHIVVFKPFYERIGYFGKADPNLALGLLTIATQGILLAYMVPFFLQGKNRFVDAMRIAAVFGAVIISVQVVGAAAKNHAPATAEWFLVEGIYFVVQFLFIGFALAFIHRRKDEEVDTA